MLLPFTLPFQLNRLLFTVTVGQESSSRAGLARSSVANSSTLYESSVRTCRARWALSYKVKQEQPVVALTWRASAGLAPPSASPFLRVLRDPHKAKSLSFGYKLLLPFRSSTFILRLSVLICHVWVTPALGNRRDQ